MGGFRYAWDSFVNQIKGKDDGWQDNPDGGSHGTAGATTGFATGAPPAGSVSTDGSSVSYPTSSPTNGNLAIGYQVGDQYIEGGSWQSPATSTSGSGLLSGTPTQWSASNGGVWNPLTEGYEGPTSAKTPDQEAQEFKAGLKEHYDTYRDSMVGADFDWNTGLWTYPEKSAAPAPGAGYTPTAAPATGNAGAGTQADYDRVAAENQAYNLQRNKDQLATANTYANFVKIPRELEEKYRAAGISYEILPGTELTAPTVPAPTVPPITPPVRVTPEPTTDKPDKDTLTTKEFNDWKTKFNVDWASLLSLLNKKNTMAAAPDATKGTGLMSGTFTNFRYKDNNPLYQEIDVPKPEDNDFGIKTDFGLNQDFGLNWNNYA